MILTQCPGRLPFDPLNIQYPHRIATTQEYKPIREIYQWNRMQSKHFYSCPVRRIPATAPIRDRDRIQYQTALAALWAAVQVPLATRPSSSTVVLVHLRRKCTLSPGTMAWRLKPETRSIACSTKWETAIARMKRHLHLPIREAIRLQQIIHEDVIMACLGNKKVCLHIEAIKKRHPFLPFTLIFWQRALFMKQL